MIIVAILKVLLCVEVQVQKEAVTKEYANARYQQPYQTAMYETAVALEARRWHTNEYEAVIGDLQPSDLTVRAHPVARVLVTKQCSTGAVATLKCGHRGL